MTSSDSAASPLVSIIMPAYNASRYIGTAISSVLAQTYPNWELLIVDDASTDDTLEVVDSFLMHDGRIDLLQMPRNGGVAAARNLALDNASGKYIAFLDSDDMWLPAKLEKQVAFMERESVLISYSGYQRVDEKGMALANVMPPPRISYPDLLRSNFIGNLTGIYNAEELGKEYFTNFKHEDYIAWLELVKRAGSARGVPETLALYRVYAGSLSANKIKALSWQWRIYRLHQTLGFFQSCKLMFQYGGHALYKRM